MAIKQRSRSLKSRKIPLSNTFYQLKVLNGAVHDARIFPKFEDQLSGSGCDVLKPVDMEILQVNVGKLCNQSCAHCHVDAGPDRTEIMPKKLLERCLEIMSDLDIPTLDITGGAPELNPHFRWFVKEAHALGKQIITRCNLTIIVSNPRFHDLPDFFAKNSVQVVSSLPHYSRHRTDAQRGKGVFEDSIRAMQLLNAAGYGKEGTGLQLDIVYNPTGAFLPSSQAELEAEFKRQLKRRHHVVFNRLYTIANLPISRFLEYLLEEDLYEEYMQKLVDAFNPATIEGLMCRNTLSVSWDGFIYDCDFNQMLDLKVSTPGKHIMELDMAGLRNRTIVTGQHCYGCTAGAGSSCGGEILVK